MTDMRAALRAAQIRRANAKAAWYEQRNPDLARSYRLMVARLEEEQAYAELDEIIDTLGRHAVMSDKILTPDSALRAAYNALVERVHRAEGERDELRAAFEAAMTGWRVRDAEVERLRALEAIVREHSDHRELAAHLRKWLAPDIDAMQTERDDRLMGVTPEPESWPI